MRNKPLVSVIMIFLNAEKFIQEAIESVFAQTYDNWELLLVDDGSTDTSTQNARRYAEQYLGKVYYLDHVGHQNCGMSASRNLGIHNAKGGYIAFLDSDDVWLPNKLERQVALLSWRSEADMVYGTSQYWYSWTGNPEDVRRDYVAELGVPSHTLFKPPKLLPLLYPLGNVAAPCPSDILLRRGIIERVGGFEERFQGIYQLYEDQAFLAKLYLHGAVLPVNECWDRYRIHPNSCGSVVAKAGQYHTIRSFFLHWLATYLSKQGITDHMLWKALRHALWPYRHPILHRLSNRTQPFVKRMKGLLKVDTGQALGAAAHSQLHVQHLDPGRSIAVGEVNFGSLRRVEPISRDWGLDRGLPIDRYYIEGFLARNSVDIQGRVLEIGDDTYTRRFGGAQVTKSDVLHVEEGNPLATIIADLTCAEHVPSDTFDCIIFAQTLHLIYDVRATLQTLQRILKPGGVLLATFPGITQISHREWGGSWYWSFTSFSAQRLFEEVFSEEKVRVQSYGNVLAASAFLYGIATEELRQEELDYRDPDYEVTIAVRAVKGV